MGKYVGIIAAMPEEMEAIKSKMINTKEVDIFNLKFFEGKIKNQKIILVKCGVGKVNAARTTQIMIDKFDIDYIINIGSAGSINDDVEYGDIVIGKYVLQHDFDITAFGHEKGYISNIGVKLESNTKLIKRCEYVIKNMKENNYKPQIPDVMEAIFDAAYLIFDLIAAMLFFFMAVSGVIVCLIFRRIKALRELE